MSGEETAAPLAGPVVIDASVVVEYLVVLALTDAATRLFHLAAEDRVELWAPDLVYPESASALRKLVRLGALEDSAAGSAIEHLTELPLTAASTAALMPEVWKLRAFLSPYDACYAALADALGAELVTAQDDLAAELRKRGKRARFLGEI